MTEAEIDRLFLRYKTVWPDTTPWVGMDLDGTLSHFSLSKYLAKGESFIGPPFQNMIDLIKSHLAKGRTVKIFTARISKNKIKNIKVIQDWLESIGLPRLEVTNVKNHTMIVLYDDRVTEVVFNTGELRG